MKYLALAVGLVLVLAPKLSFCDAVEDDFKAITDSIPQNWWDGGWDKLKELQSFISNNPDNAALCAKAQYYIGCYYYSTHQYQKAIEAYRTVRKAYPSVTSECANAQFEIAQITLNCLNKPKEAIIEYQKVISNYPNSWPPPAAQLMMGRVYIKLGNIAQAKIELQKVIDNYPLAKKQRAEACIGLGDISMSEGTNKEALSYYKKAFLACPPADSSMMGQIMDKIYEGFRGLDSSVARANQFIKYQKYGPAGEDKTAGTGDDLTDLLAEF